MGADSGGGGDNLEVPKTQHPVLNYIQLKTETMKDNKLISMTDFVIQQRSELMFKELGKACCKYADFLKQPLKLEMFVPCDDDGNVLSEQKPNDLNGSFFKMQESFNYEKQFDEAKEKVLFEGFEYVKFINDGELLPYHRLTKNDEYFNVRFLDRNIEDLLTEFEYGIELTPTAIKQIQP